MTFFEPLPPPPPTPGEGEPTGWVPPLWDRPSEATLGGAVGMNVLLAKAERVAVAFSDIDAYPNGFTFALLIRSNPMFSNARPHPGMFGMGPPGMARGPRIGFEFADGTRASGLSPMPHSGTLLTGGHGRTEAGLPAAPVLIPRGGGGGGSEFRMQFWCYPLPPAGPMTVYLEWTDVGMDETSITVDAAPIVEAAANALVLWEPAS